MNIYVHYKGEFGLVYRGCLTGWQGRATAEVVAVKTLKGIIDKIMAIAIIIMHALLQ